LQELLSRGIKKVGKDKITELEKREEDLDYDLVMNFYQNVLRREKEAIEIFKNKKVNDVEIWARALKEEESIAMKDYCRKNGKEEMENIRKAVQEKHAKELQTKKALESASGAFGKYKIALLEMRKNKHQEQQVDFSRKQGVLAKEEIIGEASKQLQIIMVRKLNEAAAEERRKRDLERQAKERAEGREVRYEGRGEDTPDAWGRGSAIQTAKETAAENDKRQMQRTQNRETDNNNFTRGQNVIKAGEPTKPGPPSFTRSTKPREDAP